MQQRAEESTAAIFEQSSCAPMPIWVAALMVSHCSASADGSEHAVPWRCEGGRLVYTNSGSAAERIEPIGVKLESGHTIAVSWVPRETSYTIEVYCRLDRCA